jgi:hypothetical protein
MSMRTADHPSIEIDQTPIYPGSFGGDRQGFGGAVSAEDAIAGNLAKAIAESIAPGSGDTSRDLGWGGGHTTHTGAPRTTTTLNHVIEGTAELIQRNVAFDLSTRADPIKSMLGQKIVKVKKVIVTTRVITGGVAELTPDRAAAPVVSTGSQAHEFDLERYGINTVYLILLMNKCLWVLNTY